MTVERIVTTGEFARIRGEYEKAYASDPWRSVFVSWSWMSAYFRAMRRRWTLLVARDEGVACGFCLLIEGGLRIGPARIYRELALGAYPTADYTSIVVDPRREDVVLRAFGEAIGAMEWDVLRASNVRDPRVARLIAIAGVGCEVAELQQNPAHFVALPASWPEYVQRLNGGRRYVARRYRTWREARLTEATDENVDSYIETLLELHQRRWNTNIATARRTYGRLFREAYGTGCCRIAVLWSADERPLAAQAAFTDAERRSWGVYMLAYDNERPKGSPGIGMLAKGLELAIEQGYSEYDFLRGEEPYKSRFGTELRMLENFVAARRTNRRRVAAAAYSCALGIKAALRRILFGRTL
ncbi:MAG: GNAT family N-acetyltransferase [Candidatus Tyrphobacter sp.]